MPPKRKPPGKKDSQPITHSSSSKGKRVESSKKHRKLPSRSRGESEEQLERLASLSNIDDDSDSALASSQRRKAVDVPAKHQRITNVNPPVTPTDPGGTVSRVDTTITAMTPIELASGDPAQIIAGNHRVVMAAMNNIQQVITHLNQDVVNMRSQIQNHDERILDVENRMNAMQAQMAPHTGSLTGFQPLPHHTHERHQSNLQEQNACPKIIPSQQPEIAWASESRNLVGKPTNQKTLKVRDYL